MKRRVLAAGIVGLLTACSTETAADWLSRLPDVPYNQIFNVPTAVNALGKLIAQEQRAVVTPGGNQYAPGYSAADQSSFESSPKLAEIVAQVKGSSIFRDGVASIRTLSAYDRARVFSAYETPLYPTWAMNGHIGEDGTTNAGYAVEGEIASALTEAVKAAL